MIRISDAEFEVMKVIWKRGETTSLEIIDDLKSFKWNFNTVRTLIKRLQNKGAIEIIGKKGKSNVYRPLIDEKKYKNELTKDLIRKLYNDSIEDFVLQYCREAKITGNDIREIINELEEREKNK